MKTSQIIFTGIFIQIRDEFVNLDYLKNKLVETNYHDPQDNGGVNYTLSFIDNFLKIDYNYGRSLPRPENVINLETQLPESNPRSPNQYEPKQNFALLDCEKSLLWLSNSRKQSLIIDFLKRNLNEPKIYPKNVYDEETFLKTIKLLDEIRFSVAPDLFSSGTTLSDALADEVNGYGGSIATLRIKYDEPVLFAKVFNKIANIFNHRDSFKNIVISGRDEQNLGMLFNQEMFSRKIVIRTEVDNNENYDINKVFDSLIKKINNENS